MDVQLETTQRRRGRPHKASIQLVDNTTSSFLRYQVQRLELAMSMRSGVMDSESKHMEIANNVRAIVLAVIDDMKAKADG